MEDPDLTDLLSDLEKSSDPSQVRTFKILDAMRKESLVEMDTIKNMDLRQL